MPTEMKYFFPEIGISPTRKEVSEIRPESSDMRHLILLENYLHIRKLHRDGV